MPITNSVVVGTAGNYSIVEFTDHLSNVFQERWIIRQPTEAEFFSLRIAQLENNVLPRQEIETQFAIAQNGGNPDKVPPDHQTQADFDRHLIAALMKNTSIETTIAALPFWTAHQARSGNNNPQRASTLGVPTPEYAEADSRFGVAQGIAGGVNTWLSETWDSVPSEAWR